MAAKQAAATPPTPPAPPPVPVSGVPRQLQAKAPELTETPKGQNPQAEFNARQKAAIERATAAGQKAVDDAAGEDAAPPPKAKQSASASSAEVSASSATTAAEKKPAVPASEATGQKTAESEPERRYDVQSLRKWAEKNPEEAALVREKVFGLPPDTNQEWIRLKNRERKLKEGIHAEREMTLTQAKAERQAAEEAKAAIDQAAGKLAPIADLWEAVAEKIAADPQNPLIDFEAADAAFQENAKISIDDYMRLRARRAIGSGPDAVRLRAENARLKRELAGKPSDAIKTKAAADEEVAAPAAAEEQPKPKANPARDWSTEIAGNHKLRQFENWNALLDAEMRKHHDSDLDEYSADPDEIADKILRREIEAMSTELEPETPAPRARTTPKPAATNGKKPAAAVPAAAQLTPKLSDPDEDDAKVGGMTWAQRQKRAIDRAMARARGELE